MQFVAGFFSPFPFFQNPVWDSAPCGGWKEQHGCLWKSCFPCHMTSVGYIATFHMAAQTQTVVFMKILLIPTWSLPGTQGSFLGCVWCVLLRGAADKGWLGKPASPPGAPCSGTAPLHPEQEQLCRRRAQLQEAPAAWDLGVLGSRPLEWAGRRAANLWGRGLDWDQKPWFGWFCY